MSEKLTNETTALDPMAMPDLKSLPGYAELVRAHEKHLEAQAALNKATKEANRLLTVTGQETDARTSIARAVLNGEPIRKATADVRPALAEAREAVRVRKDVVELARADRDAAWRKWANAARTATMPGWRARARQYFRGLVDVAKMANEMKAFAERYRDEVSGLIGESTHLPNAWQHHLGDLNDSNGRLVRQIIEGCQTGILNPADFTDLKPIAEHKGLAADYKRIIDGEKAAAGKPVGMVAKARAAVASVAGAAAAVVGMTIAR